MNASAPSMQRPSRWPLVTTIGTRDSTGTKDARLINGYVEKDPDVGEFQIYKRLGYSTPIYAPNAPGFGMYLWEDESLFIPHHPPIPVPAWNLYTIAGNTLYSNGSFLATLGPNQATARWQQIRGSPPLLVTGDGNTAWIINAQLGTVTQITDPNFPSQFVPGFAYLDGTLYVMDQNGVIYGSQFLDNPVSWSASPPNTIIARIETDFAIGLFKHLQYVVAVKRWTMEAFYDAGNAIGSPLLGVPSAFNNFGCVSADTIQSIDGINFWLTSNQTLSPQVVRLENLQPTLVSNPPIERLLDRTLSAGFRSFTIKHAGHRFYGLTSLATNQTFVLDIDYNIWYPWTNASGGAWPIGAISYNSNNQHLGQDYLTGAVYAIDDCYNYATDNGQVVPVDIYTPSTDFGTRRRKTLHRMYIRSDQASNGILYVRRSDDDYKRWSNFRQVNLGKNFPSLDAEGTFVKRAYHFRHASPEPLRIRSVDLQMDIGVI